MQMKVHSSPEAMAKAASDEAAEILKNTIAANGSARVIAATGAAQFHFLENLTAREDIPGDKIELFHLDEYLGVPPTHPASFSRFLQERLISKMGITNAHLMDGTRDPQETIREVTAEIKKAPIDLAIIGIGENGHLAFNDPPADFTTEASFILVELDEPCRQQQFGEGWFPSLDAVPRTAISMTVKEILKATRIIAIVPERRKAEAVARCFESEVSPMRPASILRTHANASLYLDRESSSLLHQETIDTYRG